VIGLPQRQDRLRTRAREFATQRTDVGPSAQLTNPAEFANIHGLRTRNASRQCIELHIVE
jgi:hypothetical protein